MNFWVIIFLIGIAIYANCWLINKLRAEFTEKLEAEKQKNQRAVDNLVFFSGLFYRTAAQYHIERKEFEALIIYAYDRLPVRGGGSGHKNFPGFWDNVFSIHGVPLEYNEDGASVLDELQGKKLASVLWLSFEHDLKKTHVSTKEKEVE